MVLEQLDSHVQKNEVEKKFNEVGSLFYIICKKELKTDQRPKWKTKTLKT